MLAAVAAWFGYRVHRQHVRLLSRFEALEGRVGSSLAPRAAAGVEPHPRSEDDPGEARFLVIMAMKGGLFVEVMKVVTCLERFADSGATPIVYFNRARFLYWGDDGWRGARNGWEYYFHPLSEQRIEDLVPMELEDLDGMSPEQIADLCYDDVILVEHFFQDKLDPLGDVPPEQRQRFAKLWAENVRVKDEILHQVDEIAREHFTGNRVIGIHYRWSDKVDEIRLRLRLAGRDPDIVEQCHLDRYIDEALAVAGDQEALFFLATEEEAVLERARAGLGERLISTEVTRTRSNLPPFLTAGHPRLGDEALVDCLLLARCDYLVHGPSFLAYAAGLFNPALPRTNIVAKLAGLDQPVVLRGPIG